MKGAGQSGLAACTPLGMEVIAYMIRLFQSQQPISRSTALDYRLLTPKREAWGGRYYDLIERHQITWVNERLQEMIDALGNGKFSGFLQDRFHFNEEGRRFAIEHQETIQRAVCCRDIIECVLLFPQAATAEDVAALSRRIEQHMRDQRKYDFDRYSPEQIDEKMKVITQWFVTYVQFECRVIENVYKRGEFTERASTGHFFIMSSIRSSTSRI